MSSRVAGHLRSNIVGYLAVFIALSGTAYAVDGPLAGQNKVGSADIINGEVTAPDIGAGQVSTAKLTPNAVNAEKIGDGQVQASEIAQAAVGTNEVENDSLTGVDILNGSLTSLDIAKQTIERDDLAFDVGAVPLTAIVSKNGELLGGNGATAVVAGDSQPGVYSVQFTGYWIRDCVPQATIMQRRNGPSAAPNGEISVGYPPDFAATPDSIVVKTWDSTGFAGAPPAAAPRHFFLTVSCPLDAAP